jgi:uncharacterized protein YdhG (YjbR/CyaY superfamily)
VDGKYRIASVTQVMKKTGAKTVSSYLSAVPREQRAALEKLRSTIKSIVPDATEVISYDIPTFKLNGRMLVSYAAFKKHCSFFPGAGPIEKHASDLESFQTSKGTIQFTPEHPLSTALVKRLVKTRIRLNEARK